MVRELDQFIDRSFSEPFRPQLLDEGDVHSVVLHANKLVDWQVLKAKPIPPALLSLMMEGGIYPHLEKRGLIGPKIKGETPFPSGKQSRSVGTGVVALRKLQYRARMCPQFVRRVSALIHSSQLILRARQCQPCDQTALRGILENERAAALIRRLARNRDQVCLAPLQNGLRLVRVHD